MCVVGVSEEDMAVAANRSARSKAASSSSRTAGHRRDRPAVAGLMSLEPHERVAIRYTSASGRFALGATLEGPSCNSPSCRA
ncbi:hypothetical protein F2981_00875 [Sinorhizobium meliloti]|nr:hypothetical protein [Sinorhizobium meliloti]